MILFLRQVQEVRERPLKTLRIDIHPREVLLLPHTMRTLAGVKCARASTSLEAP